MANLHSLPFGSVLPVPIFCCLLYACFKAQAAECPKKPSLGALILSASSATLNPSALISSTSIPHLVRFRETCQDAPAGLEPAQLTVVLQRVQLMVTQLLWPRNLHEVPEFRP